MSTESYSGKFSNSFCLNSSMAILLTKQCMDMMIVDLLHSLFSISICMIISSEFHDHLPTIQKLRAANIAYWWNTHVNTLHISKLKAGNLVKCSMWGKKLSTNLQFNLKYRQQRTPKNMKVHPYDPKYQRLKNKTTKNKRKEKLES